MAVSRWRRGRVLIVDDDQTICAAIQLMFEDTPLSAVCVHTDRHAYAALAKPKTFRGLILDMNLGAGTTGFDVARFARKADPDLAVIFISGDPSPGALEAFGVPDAGYLQKPFGRDALLKALEPHLAY